jgi:hypothetical protein
MDRLGSEEELDMNFDILRVERRNGEKKKSNSAHIKVASK